MKYEISEKFSGILGISSHFYEFSGLLKKELNLRRAFNNSEIFRNFQEFLGILDKSVKNSICKI
jgi:hypothetical protein